jgi:hypothetical protein
MQSNFVGEVRSFVVANYLLGREDGLSNDDSEHIQHEFSSDAPTVTIEQR